jgi:Putative auto-transporter adhesin, head GIN domain
VDLPGFNNVVVRAGARQSVVVHADSNLLTRVTTRVRASRLVIGTTPGNLAAKSPMYVVVTLPSVEALILRGAGNITVSNLTLPSVEALILRGRGNITVSNLDSRRLTVGLPGAGTIRATGRAAPLDVTISGSGTALLGQLVAHGREGRRERRRQHHAHGDPPARRQGLGQRDDPLRRQPRADRDEGHGRRHDRARMTASARRDVSAAGVASPTPT